MKDFYCVEFIRGEFFIVDVVVFGCTGVVGCASDSVAIGSVAQGFLFSGLHYLIDDAEPSSPRGLQGLAAM